MAHARGTAEPREEQAPSRRGLQNPRRPIWPLLTDPVAKAPYGFSAPCLRRARWMTSRSQTGPKMCLCELMSWFNCLPNLRAAKSNKLKFTILWSHLQGDNTAAVYFVRCWSESGENYSPYIILIIIIIIKILLIGNTNACCAPLTCTIVSARPAADSAGQVVLIPWRQNWLQRHSSSQQLHAAAQEFNNRHGCSMAAPAGGAAGPHDALRGHGKSSRRGRRCQGAAWKPLGDSMAEAPTLEGAGGGKAGAAALQFLEDTQASPLVRSARCQGTEVQDQPVTSHRTHRLPYP